MSNHANLRSLLKEAEIYRAQGLLEHSKEKYLQALNFLGKAQQFSNHKRLIQAIKGRIQAVEEDLGEVDQEIPSPELPQEKQNLIKELFSYSQTREAAKMEGAQALAAFGQYERALEEFHALLKEGTLPVMAAKNILRCYLALSSADAAVAQFKKWLSADLLSLPELKLIKTFLMNLLKQHGIEAELPPLVEASPATERGDGEGEGVLDISSVIVQLNNGTRQGDVVEFNVTYQSDNTIRIIVPAYEKHLLETLRPGLRLREMKCYSPIAVFRGSGVVSGKTIIGHGPNQGDFVLDITMDGT